MSQICYFWCSRLYILKGGLNKPTTFSLLDDCYYCVKFGKLKSQQFFDENVTLTNFSLVQFSCIEIMKWEKNLMNFVVC